jgi:hypothetical protein
MNALIQSQDFSLSRNNSKVDDDGLCCVEGCSNSIKVVYTKLCNMHYKREKRTGKIGSPCRLKSPSGSGHINSTGYVQVYSEGKLTYEHIVVAEKALGKKLPNGAQVHHFDENKSNNRNSNLVICQDEKYHRLIHVRTRAYNETGHADYLKCPYCKKYDPPKKLKENKSGGYSFHPECHNISQRNRRKLKKGNNNE